MREDETIAGTKFPTLDDYAKYADRRWPFEQPLVSVVTVVLNGRATLPRTIASVQSQGCHDVEHVVVDGGSTDGTIELITSALRPGDFWISEPDAGISDAVNKGIALARGRYIQILNADDWLSPGQLTTGIDLLRDTKADFSVGDCLVHHDGRALFHYRGSTDCTGFVGRWMHAIKHPSMMVPRESYSRFGLYGLEWRYAMDYEWILRVTRAGGRGVYDARLVTHIGAGGTSGQHYRQTEREVRDVSVRHGRNRLTADLECSYRIAKASAGRMIGQHARSDTRFHPVVQDIGPARSLADDHTRDAGGYNEAR